MSILNGTVYETDDIVALVAGVCEFVIKHNKLKLHYGAPTVKKIRYLNQKKRTWGWSRRIADHEEESFASIEGSREITVCVLRPTKVELNALVALAEAAEGDCEEYCAPKKVTIDVIRAIYNSVASAWSLSSDERDKVREKAVADLASDLYIRINPKAEGRKEYALANLEKKLQGKRNNLKSQERQLKRTENSAAHYRKKVATIKADLVKMEANLAKKMEKD